MTGFAQNTIMKLLVELGDAATEYQSRTLRNLNSSHIECDEIWAFCYAKQKHVPEQHEGKVGYGDVWTWTAIDADTKLIKPDPADEQPTLHPSHQRFSKKLRNHAAAVALHHLHYNFARPHRMLANPYPRTPAMAAGISDHIWTCEEIAGLLD